MSKIEVNTIDTISGSTTMTIGSTNTSTIVMPNGALSGQNYPAFEAKRSSGQGSVADNTATKVQFDTKFFDTDSCYDNSTNYRFTPNVAGKYFVYAFIVGGASGGNSDNKDIKIHIYKNGVQHRTIHNLMNNGYENQVNISVNNVLDMNGSSDYVEIYGQINSVANGNGNEFVGDRCIFGAYRIGT